MTMPCANTTARERMEADEYKQELIEQRYKEEALDNCADRILETRTGDVIEILADDLYVALGVDENEWQAAVANRYEPWIGRIMDRVTHRIARSLVTDLELADEIARLSRD